MPTPLHPGLKEQSRQRKSYLLRLCAGAGGDGLSMCECECPLMALFLLPHPLPEAGASSEIALLDHDLSLSPSGDKNGREDGK